MPKLTTFLTFNDQAEQAARFYVSLAEGGKIHDVMRMPGGGPASPDRVLSVTFEIFGQRLVAMNGGPSFTFTSGISLFVSCDSQTEIDHLWSQLTAEGGKEVQCGWLVDRFGVSWQIIPAILGQLLGAKDPVQAGRAMQAMMRMKKLDIAALERARDGA